MLDQITGFIGTWDILLRGLLNACHATVECPWPIKRSQLKYVPTMVIARQLFTHTLNTAMLLRYTYSS